MKTIHLQKKGLHRFCEDRCLIAREDDKLILLIADGHGGEAYVRARYGARFACNAAKKVLSDNTLEGTPEEKFERIKDIYDGTVSRHLARNPLTESELKKAKDTKPSFIYGTTLIAAVLTPEYIDIYKIGDGEVYVINESGELLEVLKTDDTCIGTQTSSLAQSKERVMASFRTARYINAAACIMFTDGCEGGEISSISALVDDNESTVTESLLTMFDNTDHGDDQTIIVAYDVSKTAEAAFRNGIIDTVASLKKKRHAKATKKQNLEEYLRLCEFLRKALEIASKLQQENNPKFQDFMSEILKEHKRMEYLRSILNNST